MKNVKWIVGMFLSALVGGFIAVATFVFLIKPEKDVVRSEQADYTRQMHYASMPAVAGVVTDFVEASEKSIDAVVHVKVRSTQRSNSYSHPLYEFFYGYREPRERRVEGAGSGVLISDDGYIVTNNHVIAGSDQIEIVLNDKRSYQAKLIGADKTTDIALLKIEEKNLPFLSFGNSDVLKVGEWVLAVGNPFNLTSTVTAGVVSAKSRSINIINNGNNTLGIESFIQTDAAVNPGNSGGALVNTAGLLVGINTAIASPTGSYSGYSFAVPVSIVKKVVADLQEFGEVQRALLGIMIRDVDAELRKEKDLDVLEGVYVVETAEDGGAKEAGIEGGDVIVSVEGKEVKSVSNLQELVGRYRPGDKVSIKVIRRGKAKMFQVILKNIQGTTDVVKKHSIGIFGASFEEVSKKDLQDLGLKYGVRVTSVEKGKFKDQGVKPGFIITQMNGEMISSIANIEEVLSSRRGGIFISGKYPDGRVAYYAINPES